MSPARCKTAPSTAAILAALLAFAAPDARPQADRTDHRLYEATLNAGPPGSPVGGTVRPPPRAVAGASAAAADEPPSSPVRGAAALIAANDGSAITIKLDLQPRSEIPEDCGADDTGCMAGVTTRSLRLDAPLADGQKSGNLLSLDGLGNSTMLTLGWSRVASRWRPVSPEQDDVCDKLFEALKDKIDKKEATINTMPLGSAYRKVLEAERDGWKSDLATKNCTSALVSKHVPKDALPPSRLTHTEAGSWLYGFEASAGVRDSSHVDPATLASTDHRKTVWGLAVHVGVIPDRAPDTLFLLKLQRRLTYKDGDEGIACLTPDDGPVTCAGGAIGAPQRQMGTLLRVEARKQWMDRYAAALVATYDSRTHRKRVDVPLYLVPNGDGALIGGINLGRQTGDGQWKVTLFVGTPFTLIP